ncbi:MAG TPA: aldo/keto reductase [Blastocatellia bacterium]|nr:aldo/keto reductase [Blastocatellia bacterium]
MRKATTEGTSNYKGRFAGVAAEGHFRQSWGLWMSSIGLGSYLGGVDEWTDAAYRGAIKYAVELGCNVFDTAANYRCQRSERNFGDAFADLFAQGLASRDEIVISTKGGYIPFDGKPPRSRQEMITYIEETFIKPGVCKWEDFVQSSHCMTPDYIAHQLDQSLRNLKLECIDIYYIHNPESQLAEVSRDEFYKRLRAAFEFLETAVADGKISTYGTATWNGYRAPVDSPEYLSLERVEETAREVAGDHHNFRAVQLPFNLAMAEAFTDDNQPLNGYDHTFLETAERCPVTVMASASILQSRLSTGLSPIIAASLTGLGTDAQRAIQFTRSTPGIDVALVGMSDIAHVRENLEMVKIPPAPEEDYLKLFDKTPYRR